MTGFMHYDALQCVIFSAFDVLLWTNHVIYGLFFKCTNPKKITFNLNNNTMDIESFHSKKVKYFVESIGLTYCTKWKTFVKDLGVQVTEELKLVMKTDCADNVDIDSEFCDSNVFD